MTDKLIKILLVDDDEDDQFLIRRYLKDLKKMKSNLDWVSNYNDGYKSIEKGRYDLFLIDYRLGSESGLDLLNAVKAKSRGEPFILLTGVGDEEVDQKAMRLGAVDFLAKSSLNSDLLGRSIRYAIQRKNLEEQRIQLIAANSDRDRVADEQRMRDEFFGIASHELNTPLTSIKLYLQILERQLGNESPLVQSVIAANGQVDRLHQLIQQLLDMTRIQRGKWLLDKETFDFDIFFRETIGRLESMVDMPVLELTGSTNTTVNADKRRLRQVIDNVINNARIYAQDSSKIEINIYLIDNMINVEVQDYGPGIKKKDQKLIFNNYIQKAGATRLGQSGLGLGLFIANHIILSHGGIMTVNSKPGHGACFKWTIPAIS